MTKPDGPLKAFAERFDGLNPPLVVLINPDGEAVESYRSPPDAKEFAAALKEAAKPFPW